MEGNVVPPSIHISGYATVSACDGLTENPIVANTGLCIACYADAL